MKCHTKPAAIKPSGEPYCARPETDWTHHWTLLDCINHFGYVPALFRLLEPLSTVAAVWHHLTLGMQSKLNDEFAYYDLRTGRV